MGNTLSVAFIDHWYFSLKNVYPLLILSRDVAGHRKLNVDLNYDCISSYTNLTHSG